jgi:hypothetical protein
MRKEWILMGTFKIGQDVEEIMRKQDEQNSRHVRIQLQYAKYGNQYP